MDNDEFVRVAASVGLAIEGLGVLVIAVSVLIAFALFARRRLSANTRSGAEKGRNVAFASAQAQTALRMLGREHALPSQNAIQRRPDRRGP